MLRALLVSIAIAVAIVLAAPASARADTKKPTKTKRPKMKTFDFEVDDVKGDRINPDGERIALLKFVTFENLIRIRSSFNKQILKATENVD